MKKISYQEAIIKDIIALYPEAYEICLVGSYARNEQVEKSDMDILIKFPEKMDGWKLVCRDNLLWKKWNKKNNRQNYRFYYWNWRSFKMWTTCI